MKKHLMYAVHNLIAHPLSEILYWLGVIHHSFRDLGNWVHDVTLPADEEEGQGRG